MIISVRFGGEECRQESDLEALMTDLVKEEQRREAAAAEAAAVLQTQKTETAAARVRSPSRLSLT